MERLKRFVAWVTNSMLNRKKAKTPLLYYWTRRYLLTLVIGLILIAIVSIFWIRHTTIESKLALTKLVAQELSDRSVDENGGIVVSPQLPFILEERERFLNNREPLHFYIKTKEGNLLSPGPRGPGLGNEGQNRKLIELMEIPEEITVEKISSNHDRTAYAVISPIVYEEETIGAVFIIQPIPNLTNINKEEYELLALLLFGLALLGWFVIYSLSRKLAKPVEQVAEAAGELMRGNYDIELNEDVQEKELHQLVVSFNEMAHRLQQLESLRTELLAGVTHELKTPITSVSALIQAVNDDVVSVDRKKEFLQMSLREAKRLQSMVEDLLDFNSFSAGSIKVNIEEIDICRVVKEIVYQWEIVHQAQLEQIKLTFTTHEKRLIALGDHVRLQQILVNLLNNSLHAVKGREMGRISVELYREGSFISLDVIDNGYGIPKQNQPFIFERFYRGENKKYVERGLGLGLSFSLLLAKAQGGDMSLKESSGEQTMISLQLPLA
ncbi:ATP-binding protein [Metabacillus litoralis]|uniref:sensor histidine kinase n=1 Tax=Metabacillus litoralis TaxID=152268 RepID=UPI002041CCC8|nr:HAMP domain-containing sensor histidine kinase [Metabacillus litoralis]MCM3651673.1 HAMP domain-containing histidine kinase [Metabacillus litoralis]